MGYQLYPHGFDDRVFIIYQPEKFKNEGLRSSITPLLQWLIFVLTASLILHAIREIAKRKRRRVTRNVTYDHTVTNYLYSFIDSVAVFLGTALDTFGNSRAECWFLVSFSMFGLIFRIVYTDNLFVMFAASTQARITSIDQLFELNIPITVEMTLFDDMYVRSKS